MSTDSQSANSSEYIVTFYSHFGSVRFKRFCDRQMLPAKVMPVPRNLSSSCGTCVWCEKACEADTFDIHRFVPDSACLEEIEQVVRIRGAGYEPLYRAENS